MKHIDGIMGHRYGTIQPTYGLVCHSNSTTGHENGTIRHSHSTIEKCYGTMMHRCFIIEIAQLRHSNDTMGIFHDSIGNSDGNIGFSDRKSVHSVDSKRHRDSMPSQSNGTKDKALARHDILFGSM